MISDLFMLPIWVIIAYFSIELSFRLVILYVNSKFPWLIIEKDESPQLSKEGLRKFIPHGFDPELGWVRKPNTSHSEKGKFGTTHWRINSEGARNNLNFEKLESKISCYGDSFTFCRQVNDDETWEHFLSVMQNTNVKNFGVGNHGIDQALLRLKREYSKHKTKIVILSVVPDTVSRIMSIWKHYYEYGNTFAFKPRFVLKNNSLHQIKNCIDDESKFHNYMQYLVQVRDYDFFYKEKFKKELISFPYVISVLRNANRNFSIMYWVIKIQIQKAMNKDFSKIEWNPMKIIMKINLNWRVKLYKNSEVINLFKKIIEEYVSYSKTNQFLPVFLFLPQKDDLLFIKNHYHFYEKFLNELQTIDGLYLIDITNELLKEVNLDNLYSDDNEYGGHFSKEGNEKIASLLNKKIANLV